MAENALLLAAPGRVDQYDSGALLENLSPCIRTRNTIARAKRMGRGQTIDEVAGGGGALCLRTVHTQREFISPGRNDKRTYHIKKINSAFCKQNLYSVTTSRAKRDAKTIGELLLKITCKSYLINLKDSVIFKTNSTQKLSFNTLKFILKNRFQCCA